MPIDAAFRTHAGRVRPVNEDAVSVRIDLGVFAVADGMGGHHAGTLASGTIVGGLASLERASHFEACAESVRSSLIKSHDELIGIGLSQTPVSTVGATVVALVVDERRFACFWAGDSRVYRQRGDAIELLTRDHSLVQQMVDSGLIDPAEAEHHPDSHVVTRAVGAPGRLELDSVSGEVRTGDLFLLCSDGLTRVVPPAFWASTIGGPDLEQTAEVLLAEALACGAPDNVSLILVRVS